MLVSLRAEFNNFPQICVRPLLNKLDLLYYILHVAVHLCVDIQVRRVYKNSNHSIFPIKYQIQLAKWIFPPVFLLLMC